MRRLRIFTVAIEVGLDILCTEGEERRAHVEGCLKLVVQGVCIDRIDLCLPFFQTIEASLFNLDTAGIAYLIAGLRRHILRAAIKESSCQWQCTAIANHHLYIL